MRVALTVVCALILDASWLEQSWATQACAWIVESVEDGGAHRFELTLSVDAPTSAAVRFQGPGFTSGAMGGDMIQLDPGEAKDVDGEGLEVDAGDDLDFDVRLFDHPLSLDELDVPTGKLLAAFAFHRRVGENERTAPTDLAAKQCKPVG